MKQNPVWRVDELEYKSDFVKGIGNGTVIGAGSVVTKEISIVYRTAGVVLKFLPVF